MPDFNLIVGGNPLPCDLVQETDDCCVILQMTNSNDFNAVQAAVNPHSDLIRRADDVVDREVTIPGVTLNDEVFRIKCKAVIK